MPGFVALQIRLQNLLWIDAQLVERLLSGTHEIPQLAAPGTRHYHGHPGTHIETHRVGPCGTYRTYIWTYRKRDLALKSRANTI